MKPLPSLLLLAALLARPAAAADARRAFALDDLYRISPVTEPVISPDGRTIAYAVTSRDLASGKESVNLWRVDADGRNARALTFSDGKRNESPTFSPDGRSLAFVSDRNGDSQLFLMPLA